MDERSAAVTRPWDDLSAEERLQRVARRVQGCTACELHAGRTQAVPGVGPVAARVMLIGEAPGAQEDLRGEPFVGAAGRLLDSLLEGIGLRRDEVFITNVIKCRPPGNRDPEEAEVRACARYLDAQIATIAPAVIVILGRHALARLLPAHGPISRVHGSPVDLGGRTYVPVYHPAAALHNPHLEKDLRADFEAVRDVLHLRLARDGAAEPAPADADQLSLL